MKEIQQALYQLADSKYKAFQCALLPTVDMNTFLGVSVKKLRGLMKEMKKSGLWDDFLQELPHETYEENMLHALILSQEKDYETGIAQIERFLPFVDNWAVCDSLRPKFMKDTLPDFLQNIRRWISSSHTYTCRFGLEMLMLHFLSEEYFDEVLTIPLEAIRDDYYIKLMISWFYSTALAKNWDKTLPILLEHRLPAFEHNKTILKATESLLISDEKKAFLTTLYL